MNRIAAVAFFLAGMAAGIMVDVIGQFRRGLEDQQHAAFDQLYQANLKQQKATWQALDAFHRMEDANRSLERSTRECFDNFYSMERTANSCMAMLRGTK